MKLERIRELLFGDQLVELERIHAGLTHVGRVLDRLIDRPPPALPPPVVNVLVQGERIIEEPMPVTYNGMRDGIPAHFPMGITDEIHERQRQRFAPSVSMPFVTRVMCGGSVRVEDRASVHLRTHWPMRRVSVIVFADLERVEVLNMINGVDCINCALGACPVGYFERWDVGIDLEVQCRRIEGR